MIYKDSFVVKKYRELLINNINLLLNPIEFLYNIELSDIEF